MASIRLQQASAQMTNLHDGSTKELTLFRSVIGEFVRAGSPSLARTAASLGTSRRTLQRRLAAGRLSHSEIVRTVRAEIACVLLAGTAMWVQDIGRLLGYRTPSGFARAFCGWTGTSPRAWRRTARGEPVGAIAGPRGARWQGAGWKPAHDGKALPNPPRRATPTGDDQ